MKKYTWIPKYDDEEDILLDQIAFNSFYRGNASSDVDMLVKKKSCYNRMFITTMLWYILQTELYKKVKLLVFPQSNLLQAESMYLCLEIWQVIRKSLLEATTIMIVLRLL